MGTSASNPVVLLRDVGEVEEVAEGARQRRGGISGQRGQNVSELAGMRGAAGAAGLGERAHPLDGVEKRRPLRSAQRLAKQLPQQPHVIAQRLVRIGDHLLIVEQIEQRDGFAAYCRLHRRLEIR